MDKIEVWDRHNSTKIADTVIEREEGTPWAPVSASGKLQLVGDGGGDLSLPDGHPSIGACTYRNVVRMIRVDPETLSEKRVASFTIQNRSEVLVAPSPHSRRDFNCSGVGLIDRWNDGIILPWVDGKPQSNVRVWNYASPGLNLARAPWTTTVYQQVRDTHPMSRPTAYTDPVTSYIWGRPDPEDENHPPEVHIFRKEFTVTTPGVHAFYHSGDDRFRSWVDGTELISELPDFPADVWWWTYRAAVYLPAGNHVFAMLVQNDSGVGAAIMNCWPTDGSSLVSPPLWVSGVDDDPENDFGDYIGEWWTANHTVTPTGHTGPEILQGVLDEFHSRNTALDLSLSMTDLTKDSNGNDAVIVPEIAVQVGQPGGAVLAALEPFYDIVVDETSDGFVTKVYNKGAATSDTGASYMPGENIRYLAKHGEASRAV